MKLVCGHLWKDALEVAPPKYSDEMERKYREKDGHRRSI